MKQLQLLGTALFFSIFLSPAFTQAVNKISFETDYTIKFGVGADSRAHVLYAPGFTVNYPRIASFQSPVHALEVSAMYPITSSFHIGVSGGLAVAWAEKDPMVSGEYYHAVMVPVAGKIQFTHHLDNGIVVMPEARIGYQFMNMGFNNTPDGFYFTQKGGITTGLKMKVAKRIGTYMPSLSVGYELNVVRNDVSFGWVSGYSYEDQFSYTTKYHLLVLGVGLGL